MAARLRLAIAGKIFQSLKVCQLEGITNRHHLSGILRVNPKPASKKKIELDLLLPEFLPQNIGREELDGLASRVIESFETDNFINGISMSPQGSKYPHLKFHIDTTYFIQSLLHDVFSVEEESYVSEKLLPSLEDTGPIIVEFSSPNIAKPFHMGHLRSTIIGNFIANLLKSMGRDVKRLNYLGDWGTQFGLLQWGLEQGWHSQQEIAREPIRLLLDIYVRANEMADQDETVAAQARTFFQRMEQGDEGILRQWTAIRKYTVDELNAMYSRLGVVFDEFHWESMYGIKDIRDILDVLHESGDLIEDDQGKKIVRLDEKQSITLVKSDGSSLYITRDLAAALDRKRRYQFDRMIYVVDSAQAGHFVALKELLKRLQQPWVDRGVQHVQFGRIQGMSTRKGNLVLLSDVLDEAYYRMKAKQIESVTTKVNVDERRDVTETLALTAVIVHDLKQRRRKNYAFNWDDALQNKGDTGIRLQYTHCRLKSLELGCGIQLPQDPNHIQAHLLGEFEMIQLSRDIARFRQVLKDCHDQLEPCILVRYLFDLSHSVSVALKVIPVKNQPVQEAQARLALFSASKRVLAIGLKLLGIPPLDQM